MPLLPDFIPLSNDGMSVITAICLFFLTSGFLFLLKQIIRKTNDHDKIIEGIKMDLTEMKIDIAETSVIVKGIDRSLSEISNANKQITQILLRK